MNHNNYITYKLEDLMTDNISIPVFTNTNFYLHLDQVIDKSVIAFKTHIATRVKGEKELVFYPPRQSFWDYVLRRKPKPYKVKVIAKDVLKNPPQTSHPIIQMYEIEPISINTK